MHKEIGCAQRDWLCARRLAVRKEIGCAQGDWSAVRKEAVHKEIADRPRLCVVETSFRSCFSGVFKIPELVLMIRRVFQGP